MAVAIVGDRRQRAAVVVESKRVSHDLDRHRRAGLPVVCHSDGAGRPAAHRRPCRHQRMARFGVEPSLA